jgi:hypothetical protein
MKTVSDKMDDLDEIDVLIDPVQSKADDIASSLETVVLDAVSLDDLKGLVAYANRRLENLMCVMGAIITKLDGLSESGG